MGQQTAERTDRPHWTVRIAAGLTGAAAGLLLLGMVVELAAGGSATTVGWPVVWSSAMIFFAAMTLHGRQWGRVMLATQAGLTWLLFGQLVVTEPSLLDSVGRPDLVVGLTLASAIVQTVAAAIPFTPPSNAYFGRTREAARVMSPRLRKAILTVHVIGSVAWMAIISVQSALAAVARTVGDDRALLRSLYEAQYVVENLFLGKASFVALFSGLALALGTAWRLVHHRWVVAKFALTVTVMILPIVVYQPVLDRGYALVLDGYPADEVNSELGFPGILPATGLSPLMLLTAAVLSTYKPGKRTLYGRRLPLRTGGTRRGTDAAKTRRPPAARGAFRRHTA
ncbi:hypothetical protein KIPE111705_03470 [Kibdelosporangium persicum]|uniref:Integral membrane protein n=1 Tax=Kibdelosporangium persicum TaxID=2698649 RepID=A0ABX2F861_9PSEU|nr:hypothetical protein [Kibdelosporangium persicum]NRN67383.1 hypothetical protein [Kibdelosporangium persicum]